MRKTLVHCAVSSPSATVSESDRTKNSANRPADIDAPSLRASEETADCDPYRDRRTVPGQRDRTEVDHRIDADGDDACGTERLKG
jgi:hypothetical protein